MRTLSGNNILNPIPLVSFRLFIVHLYFYTFFPFQSNRYSYSSPVSKSMLQNVSEDLWNQFTCDKKLGSRVVPDAFDGCMDKDDDGEEDDNVWDGYTEEDNKGNEIEIYCYLLSFKLLIVSCKIHNNTFVDTDIHLA